MGSCISKCKPKAIKPPPPPLFDFNNIVQDKLVVIPQPPPLAVAVTAASASAPSLSLSNKISPYPPSPSPSSSSTCLSSSTTTTTTNSSFSTASSRSPILPHDYFWSPYNQNPHVVRINSLKASTFSPPFNLVSPVVRQRIRHPSPQRVSRSTSTSTSTPQKRVRQASPSPVRQKSFRKEVQRPLSPSPSRRLSGEKCRVATGVITGASVKTIGRKSRSPARGCEMKKERITCIHRISSKIDEAAAREAVLNEGDLDSAAAMEDIDNPLISLDCFIFL